RTRGCARRDVRVHTVASARIRVHGATACFHGGISMTPDTRITVVLVDDHAVVREGYRRLLERAGDVRVVGEAASAAEACKVAAQCRPDVVVMDISLPDISGSEGMRRMLARNAGIRVLMFSIHDEPIFPRRAFAAGAR